MLLKVEDISSSVSNRAALPQHDSLAESVASPQGSHTHGQAAGPENATQQCSVEALEVHAPFASTDSVLTWPIFAGQWPPNFLSRELLVGSFHFNDSSNDWSALPSRQHQGPGIREEHVPQLVDRFLQLVHSKNPILYIEQIRDHARRIAEDGFSWDAPSCIVVSY